MTGENPALAVTYWEPTVGTRPSVSGSQLIVTSRTEISLVSVGFAQFAPWRARLLARTGLQWTSAHISSTVRPVLGRESPGNASHDS